MRGWTFMRAGPGRLERRHVEKVVWDDRAPRRRLDQRVDVDELRAAAVGLGQRSQHPGRVRRGVVAHEEEHVGLLPVDQVDRPLAGRRGAVRARPLASWHMFEQSGRLFVPNSRTHSWYRNVASLLSRPDV